MEATTPYALIRRAQTGPLCDADAQALADWLAQAVADGRGPSFALEVEIHGNRTPRNRSVRFLRLRGLYDPEAEDVSPDRHTRWASADTTARPPAGPVADAVGRLLDAVPAPLRAAIPVRCIPTAHLTGSARSAELDARGITNPLFAVELYPHA